MQTQPFWTAVDEQTAVRWEQDPETGEFNTTALVMYGPITSERLHDLKPSKWDTTSRRSDVDMPTAGVVESVDALNMAGDLQTALDRAHAHTPLEPRQEDETADQFYKRVAARFKVLQARSPGRVTAALAETSKPPVPYTTAVHWVREARRRGHLPKSGRQLRNAGTR